MNAIILLSAVAMASAQIAIPAATVRRVPSHDSAIIQSHRLGGNFAYSTHEAHAYAVDQPIIETKTVPVGVSYTQGAPVFRHSTGFINAHVPQRAVVQVAGAPITTYAAAPVASYAAAPIASYAAAPITTYAAGHGFNSFVAGSPITTYAAGVPYPYSFGAHSAVVAPATGSVNIQTAA